MAIWWVYCWVVDLVCTMVERLDVMMAEMTVDM